eukprot:g3056.t1
MDRALKRAAKGEDLTLGRRKQSVRKQKHAQDGGIVGRISGPATEDCAIRQQLKLVAKKKGTSVAILSVSRRDLDGDEELIGQCTMDVQNEQHHDACVPTLVSKDVHWLKLLDEGGRPTGVEVRLRVKLKVQKPHLSKANTLNRMDSAPMSAPTSPRLSPREKVQDGTTRDAGPASVEASIIQPWNRGVFSVCSV